MNIRVELPEIFVFCSAWLFISSLSVYAWLFFSLGVLGSLLRLGFKLQEQQQQAEVVNSSVESLKSSADNFVSVLNEALSGNKNNNTNYN